MSLPFFALILADYTSPPLFRSPYPGKSEEDIREWHTLASEVVQAINSKQLVTKCTHTTPHYIVACFILLKRHTP
jgi:hypothetical protein